MALFDNIAAWYKLDESSGNAADATGNGKTLTNTGSVAYAAAKINNGMQGGSPTDNYLSIADALGFSAAGDMTWNLWFKAPSTFTGYILANITNATDHLYCIIYCNSSNRITMFANGNEVTSAAKSTNTWYMITVTKTGSTWALYINASSVSTTSTGSGNYTGGVGFMLGNSLYTGGSPTNGIIDEVGVWNRALSGAEITTLYNSGAGMSYSSTTPKTISVTAAGVTSVFKGLSKTAAVTALGVVSVQKSVPKILAVVGTGITNIVKQASKTIAVISIGVVDVLAQRVTLQTIDVIATGIVNMTYIPGKLMNVTATGVVEVTKGMSKTIDTTALGIVAITKGLSVPIAVIATGIAEIMKSRLVTLDVIATGIGSMTKSILKTIDVTAEGLVDVSTMRAVIMNVTAIGVVNIQKTAGKMLSVIATAIVYISKGSPWRRIPKVSGTWTRQPKP